jgi:putative tricarboxylic transport membrane protein
MTTLIEMAVHLASLSVLLAALVGVTWGVIGGAMPGLSPSISMALLLPFTYAMAPIPAIVMLAAVYVGAEYGGSIPAILIRTPGTNAAAATVIDGYEMNLQGKAGLALGISLYSGIIGSLFGLVMLVLLSEPLATVALAFTPPAYFGLGVLGISIVASLSGKSLLKGFIACLLGLMVATIGTDPVSGANRFTFGSPELLSGVEPILVMMGLFAMTELFAQSAKLGEIERVKSSPRIRFPAWPLARRLIPSQLIGCVLGTFEGVTPGGGGTVASFLAYNEARRWSRRKEEFGKGSPEGIAAPETANNVVAETALVPLLSFGVPGSNSAAVLLGGFLIHGMLPGPMLFERSADVVYGLYAGLFAASVFQLVVAFAILPTCIWLVNRPRPYLMAFIYALVFSGVYSINHSLFDLAVVLIAGVVGLFMRLLGFPILPTVLGVVLGFMIESNYRRSLVLSNGDLMIFLQDPIALGLLVVSAIVIAGSLGRHVYERRKPAAAPDPTAGEI